MYYRRKLLLATLEKANNQRVDEKNLQKIVFLISQKQENPCFDFIPGEFGCFSFQAHRDLEVLSRFGIIENNNKEWILTQKEHTYFDSLKEKDQEIIQQLLPSLDIAKTNRLIQKVYRNNPYFTIYSTRPLSALQKKKQQEEKRKIHTREKKIFSIGYEGISIETYLNVLIKNNILLLCDVRKNSFSRKYGFSKNQLIECCKKINIAYIHIPELGIDSQKRKNLNVLEDYRKLFYRYEIALGHKQQYLDTLKKLLDTHKRVALTCFERDFQYCHRSTLLNYYIQKIEKIPFDHLC